MKKFLIALIMMFCYPLVTFAYASQQPKDHIINSLEHIFANADSDNSYSYDVTDDTITINNSEGVSTFNYTIDDNYATFTKKYTVENGVSYEEYKKNISSLSDVLTGYLIIADMKDINIEKATTYVFMIMLNSLNFDSNADLYWIVDDEVTMSGGKYVTESEFPNKAVEVAKTNNPASEFRDNNEDWTINSLLLKLEQKNETQNSIDLVETLKIDLNADFSKLNEITEMSKLFEEKDTNDNEGSSIITDAYETYVESQTDEKSDNSSDSNNQNNTVNNPKTGINKYTYLLGAGVIALGLLASLKRKKLFKNM